MPFRIRALALLVCCSLLVACASVPQTPVADRLQPQLEALEAWQQQRNGQRVSLLSDLVAVPALQRLVQRGLANNPGLQQNALAIDIARQALVGARGGLLPQVSAGVGREEIRSGDGQFKSSLDVSWALDITGRLSDGVNVQQASVVRAVPVDRYGRDLLAANIMDIWLQQVQQARLTAIEQQRLQVLEQNEQTIVERYRKGLDELTGLETARSNSASARATLAQYQENARALQRAMAVLLGETAYTAQVSTDYPSVIVPLAGLPVQDLGRRPDLQQAYLDTRIADLNRDIAYKALLPSFSLTLALSDSAGALRESLFTSPAWSLLGQLSAPLFRGGQLRADVERARLSAEQRYWAYRGALLSAVKEVEDALGQERALTAQQQHIESALASAERSYNNYLKKYREGLVPFLDLLTVQTGTFDLQAQQSQIIYQRLSNRITLGLALGLGIGPDVAASESVANPLSTTASIGGGTTDDHE